MSQHAIFLPQTQAEHIIAQVNRGIAVTEDSSLDGLTLAVKDVFHMAGLPTTAGNPDWLHTHAVPDQTSSAVTELLGAGANFVGKTITDEIAYSLNGQNIHYGTPPNFAALQRLPGGSSSGSAAAVLGGYADIGLGTDTGGSIRVPASYNGLFGLRPTHGVIAMDNMVPLAPSFDTVGWMTRNLEDLQRVAEVLLPQSSQAETALKAQTPIGVLSPALAMAAHKADIEHWLARVRVKVSYVEAPELANFDLAEVFRVLQGREIIQQHGEWLAEQCPKFADDIQLRFTTSANISDEEYAQAKQSQRQFTHYFSVIMQEYPVLIVPTTPGIAPLLDADSASLQLYRKQLLSLTALAGLSGCPQLHLPTLHFHNAPCGISLIGQRGADNQLIQTAKALLGQDNNEK